MDLELKITEDLKESEVYEIIRARLSNLEEEETTKVENTVSSIKKARKALESINDKFADRERIIDKLRQSHVRKAKELERAETSLKNSVSKRSVLGEEQENITSSIRSLERFRSNEQRKLDRTKSSLGEVGLTAKSVAMVKDLLSPGSTVSINDTEFSWATREIYIKDDYGTYIPFSFGVFDITITLKESGVLHTLMLSRSPKDRHMKIHPHVVYDGQACLGNVSKILIDNMELGNIGLCIEIVDKFLTHYNARDPYLSLNYWTPSSYHTPSCECGLRLMTECTCPRCQGCKTITPGDNFVHVTDYPFEVAPDSGMGCGHCTDCCDKYHRCLAELRPEDEAATGLGECDKYSAAEDLSRISSLGINRSQCWPKEALIFKAWSSVSGTFTKALRTEDE